MLKKTLILATTCALFAPAVSALDRAPSFNYAAIHYQELNSNQGRKFDGTNLEISGHLGARWFVSASYAQVSHDLDNGSTDRDLTYGRLGYLAWHQNQLALYAGPQLMYVATEIPFSTNTNSDTSLGAFAGLRFMATPSVELKGEISYADFADGSSRHFVQYTLGARAFITQRLALEASAQFGDWDGLMLGGSVHF